jgi:renal tumor antigen
MLDSLTKNYALISKIGEGSFSEVLKVKDIYSQKLFACKRLLKPFVSVQEVENYSELKTFKKLNYHPNIINLVSYVYEPENQMLCLIFNLMDMSMYDYIKDLKKKISESRCQNYLFQLVHAINYLHQNGIFHR